MTTAEHFLGELACGVDDGFLLLWRLEGKTSQWWAPGASPVPPVAAEERDLYVGVALSPLARGENQRCKAADVSGLLGLVADLDMEDPQHKRANLPQSADEARAIVTAIGLQPTAIVHSGHGLQAWWLFREPWMFADDDERARAQLLAKQWGAHVRLCASNMGYAVDSVHDLARVMRVPGTVNAKDKEAPVACTLLEEEWGRRYNPPDDFAEWLTDEVPAVATAIGTRPLQDSDMREQFPLLKHEAFMENDRIYRNSWNHKRKDLGDQSLSGYDLSLATLAAYAGWTAGEIVALIRQHRAKYGEITKGFRPDYVQGVVDLAMAAKATVECDLAAKAQSAQEHAQALEVLQDDESSPAAKVSVLATKLQIPLTAIKRVTGQVQLFYFYFGEKIGEVPVVDLATQDKFRKAMYGTCGILPARVKPKDAPSWDELAMLIYAAAEETDSGQETEVNGETWSWVDAYCVANPPEPVEGCTVDYAHEPVLWGGKVWINVQYFQTWLRQQRVTGRSSDFIRQRLKLLGAVQRTFGVRNDKGRTTQSFWGISQRDPQ